MAPSSTLSASPNSGHALRESFLQRVLDPIDMLVEAIYSVLIVMTFTLGVNLINGGLAETEQMEWVYTLFWAAFGCAVAWGLIDGVMYILSSLFERGEQLRLIRSVQAAPDERAGRALVAESMEDALSHLDEAACASIVQTVFDEIRQAPTPLVHIKHEDLGGALGTFLVAVLASLPVALPLLLARSNAQMGVRLSNLVACALLFWMGHRWARYAGSNPWTTGLLLLLVGVLMVAIAIPLGG